MAKTHKCPTCGKGFHKPQGRDMHVRDVHGPANPKLKVADPNSKRSQAKAKPKRKRYVGKKLPCPTHKCDLELKHGRFGGFFGCPHYPHCDIIGAWSKHDGLFRVSTQDDRTARIEAHATFDPIWQSGCATRSELYAWLAEQMGLERDKCHIQHFDEATCIRVIELCKQYVDDHGIADAVCAM